MTSRPAAGAGVVAASRYPSFRPVSVWAVATERVLPAVIFGLLDLISGDAVVREIRTAVARTPTPDDVLVIVGRGLYFVFVSLMIILFLTRPAARSRDDRLSSGVLAMVGTFGLTAAPLLPSGPVLFRTGAAGALAESVVLVIALSMALVTLYTLGRSFSITPQARRLVTEGPYRIARHPLYLVEALAIVAVTVASGASTMMLVGVVVLASQVRRAQLEEQLLARTFPEYEEVFESVPRFVPGIY